MSIALIGITHFSKGTSGHEPVERLTGSLAFGAFARIVMVTAKYQNKNGEDKIKRVLIRAKSNIGLDEGGFEYELIQTQLSSTVRQKRDSSKSINLVFSVVTGFNYLL